MKRVATSRLVAGLSGALFACVFLTWNDPDAMPPGAISMSRWLVLLPAAFLFTAWRSVKAWASALALAGGIFAGTCVAAIVHGSNLWPIAGIYWTVVWTPPIIAGALAGAFAGWAVRRGGYASRNRGG